MSLAQWRNHPCLSFALGLRPSGNDKLHLIQRVMVTAQSWSFDLPKNWASARSRDERITMMVEIEATCTSERGQSRADDRASEAAMEDRKREGYF